MSEDRSLIRIPGRWDIPYEYAAGATATRFFREMKDHKRIMATKCPKCGRVLLPPRPFCERCFVNADTWVEVGPGGTVQAFTITFEAFAGLRKPPFIIALIKLDGAATSMAHFLGDIEWKDPRDVLERVRAGLRVAAVFKEERQGSILDIDYFRPVDGAAAPR